jgi:hypothetical protein
MTDLNLFIATISVVFSIGAVTGYIVRGWEGRQVTIEPTEHGDMPL